MIDGGLAVSVNRSWQVPPDPSGRPVARFKSMAPMVPKPGDRTGNTYIAALSRYDAFWLGFEADEERSFAVILYLDGRCALTGRQRQTDTLNDNPRNFLVVPDQPWFDCIVDQDGSFKQLVPCFVPQATATGRAMVAEIRSVIYSLDVQATQSSPAEPDGPVPLYSKEGCCARAQNSVHTWPSREVNRESLPSKPLAELTFLLVEPELFCEITGIPLPAEMFEDIKETPPSPHNPFGPP